MSISMLGRLLALTGLLVFGPRLSAEGTSDAACLAFTQAQAASDALDADKDARVRADAELGKDWRAATALDVAVHFDPAEHDAAVRFSVAGSPYVWRLTPIEGGKEQLYALGPEPPPPPGGVWPTASVAAIRNDAPIAFTRGRIQPDATDEEKNARVIAELGAGYAATPIEHLREALGCVLPPELEEFVIRGHAGAHSVSLVERSLSIAEAIRRNQEREGDDAPVVAERR